MNISMYTRYIWVQDFPAPTDAFRHFFEKGVRYADIVDFELEEIPLHHYCTYLNDAGMAPGALVSMCNILDANADERHKNISKVKNYIDRMGNFGINFLMLSPAISNARSKDEFLLLREMMVQSFGEVADYSKGSGITVAIENRSELTRPDSKAEDVLFILNSVPDLKLVFDTGNFFCVGENVLLSYQKLSHKIARVHAKDWKTDPFGTFVRENIPRFNGVALGDGEIPIKNVVSLLKKDNFNGEIVIEIDSDKVTTDMLDKSSDFLRGELSV